MLPESIGNKRLHNAGCRRSRTSDAAGRRTGLDATVNAAADLANDYVYDAFGQLTRVEQSGTGVSAKRVDLAYDDLGRFESITRYEDLAGTLLVATSAYAYDGLGRLTGLTHAKGANVLADYDYGYDLLDRLTSAVTPDGTVTYDYDQTSQLTAADHSSQTDESYSYDSTGNRTNTGYSTGTNNRLLSDGTYNYEYDDEGNRTKRTEIATGDYIEYRWDNRNRLSIVTFRTAAGAKTKEVTYRYDMFDRRIAKDVDDNGDGVIERGEWYVYDGGDLVLKTDRDGNVTNRYLHGPSYDQVFADEDAVDGILWALADNLGTVRDWVEFDSGTDTTSVTNHVRYDSFGNILSQSDPSHTPQFGFTGQDWDADIGLYFYHDGIAGHGRPYDPITGTFLKPDQGGFAMGDANLYRYVGNAPTNSTDPSGLQQRGASNAPDIICFPSRARLLPPKPPSPPPPPPPWVPLPPPWGPVRPPWGRSPRRDPRIPELREWTKEDQERSEREKEAEERNRERWDRQSEKIGKKGKTHEEPPRFGPPRPGPFPTAPR